MNAQTKWQATRARFHVPPGKIYLDGNSLGVMSIEAEAACQRVLAEWKSLGIDGWLGASPPWWGLAEQAAGPLARLLGTRAEEVIATGSTTVNLHQLLGTLYHPTSHNSTAGRFKVLVDDGCFPSDGYAVQSHVRLRGGGGLTGENAIVRVSARQDRFYDEADFIAAMTADVAVVLLPAVVYTTGQLLDMPRITAAARERGIVMLWDLSHSIGVVDHDLGALDADGAFWCSYKYLSAGPGAVGGLYLNPRHHGKVTPGMAGWWGSDKEKMFEMAAEFTPAKGAWGLQIGTPHMLSLAPVEACVKLVADVGIEAIRRRSTELTELLLKLAKGLPSPFGIATPEEAARRGGHVAITHPNSKRLCAALGQRGVIVDFRPPDILRFAPVPLYIGEHEIQRAIDILADVATSLGTS